MTIWYFIYGWVTTIIKNEKVLYHCKENHEYNKKKDGCIASCAKDTSGNKKKNRRGCNARPQDMAENYDC